VSRSFPVARWLGTRPPPSPAGCWLSRSTACKEGQRARHDGIFQASAPAGGVGSEGEVRAGPGDRRGRAAPRAAGVPGVRLLDGGAQGHAAGEQRVAASRSRGLAARGSLPPPAAVVPDHGARTEGVPFARRARSSRATSRSGGSSSGSALMGWIPIVWSISMTSGLTRVREVRPPPRAPSCDLHRPVSRGAARQPGAR
jgi:hypothetical protein